MGLRRVWVELMKVLWPVFCFNPLHTPQSKLRSPRSPTSLQLQNSAVLLVTFAACFADFPGRRAGLVVVVQFHARDDIQGSLP